MGKNDLQKKKGEYPKPISNEKKKDPPCFCGGDKATGSCTCG